MTHSKPMFVLAMAFLFSALVGTNAWYKENGLVDVMELREAIATIDEKIDAVENENGRLRREALALRTSDAYVEAIARQSLGLVKRGEIVFEFVHAAPAQHEGGGERR